MQLEELQKLIKSLVEGKKFEQEMWRYIQDELTGVIMYWQKDQLFEKSIGSDGIKFGKYTTESRSKGRDLSRGEKRKTRNLEYTLIDTGDFYDGLRIKVNRHTKTIDIWSETDHMDEMYENPAFNTHNFFGLTPNSLRHIRVAILEHMNKWARYRIAMGRPL